MEEFITEPRRFFFFFKSLITFTVVPDALGLQDNLQIIMMVAMRMAEQPVDKASKQFLPLSVWTVLCGQEKGEGRRRRERVNREVGLKLESYFNHINTFQIHIMFPYKASF